MMEMMFDFVYMCKINLRFEGCMSFVVTIQMSRHTHV